VLAYELLWASSPERTTDVRRCFSEISMAPTFARAPRALALALASTLTACAIPLDEEPGGTGPKGTADENAEPPNAATIDAGARALAFVTAEPARVFADAETTFTVRRVLEEGARTHVHLERRHRGLRVIGGDVIVHLGDGAPPPSATLQGCLVLDAIPTLLAVEAIEGARKALSIARSDLAMAELVAYARGGSCVLAYEVVLRDDHAAPPFEVHAFVAARDGQLLDQWDAVERLVGKGKGFYSGSVELTVQKKGVGAILTDAARGNLETVDAMNKSGAADKDVYSATKSFGTGSLASRASVAVDVHYAMQQTWDYFALVHARNGIDGAGHGLFARAHYGSSLANAFYDPLCDCINLGDGDPSFPGGALGPLASLDVVAHEVTHAVTMASAGLYPSGEAGALNEATSDIFGSMVERRANIAKDPFDWLVGERVRPPHGLRSMPNPEADGLSKGCWSAAAKGLDPHFSSGIANHFFYLLAEGTTAATHTCKTNASFAGLGADKAAAIWYRSLTVYLTNDASFADARSATVQSATDLYGAKSIEAQTVASAWNAVKVK
jgi:Zn-dependent metalloprotease